MEVFSITSRAAPRAGRAGRSLWAPGAEGRRGSEETTFLITLVDWKFAFVKNYSG